MVLKYKGSADFRQRLVCATLSGKTLRIDDIRAQDTNPGLRDHEVSLLRLLEKISNGCVIEINETGTSLRYRPGLIMGGFNLQHDCGTSRAIGYFVEPLVSLAMFGKKVPVCCPHHCIVTPTSSTQPLSITLRGITNDERDPSVDMLRAVTWPLLRQLTGVDDGWECKATARGAQPKGGGEVVLKIPVVRSLLPVSLTDEGMVKRVRGVAFSCRMPPQTSNRLVDGVRGMLNDLLADVYVFTDHMSGAAAGASPGYGVTLVAETTSGRLVAAQASSQGQAAEGVVPEDVGQLAAARLLEEVGRGGVVDTAHQPLVLLLCALGPDELNQVRLGPLSGVAIRTLRLLRDFMGVTFAIRGEHESKTVFLSCLGSGFRNVARKVS